MEKIHPAVVAVDEQFNPSFGGESAAALVKKALTDLDAAQAEQEVSLTSIPRQTLEIYETKGKLLAKIEEMNKVAKIVFWGQSDIVGQFNKDILNRGRKSQKKGAVEGA